MIVAESSLPASESMGWLSVATLKEPYRLEGKKTMGLELAEQSNWELPDVILYPTGGGTGLIGMWKAFQELQALGWLENDVYASYGGCSIRWLLSHGTSL